jgi:hypothetical protein
MAILRTRGFAMTPKVVLGSVLLVAAILLAAMASNRVLDAYGIANAEGFTIDQRKENARERQYDWDRRGTSR